ncbi:MAG: hypothetical protein JO115_25140 [Pseudonocardiales bacterium]|nr:hypothetical protein [Pseudonocardiales bacterium]
MDDTRRIGVFINCPFDNQYKKCQFAIILTVVACGLQPRSSLETATVSTPRMKRISDAIRDSEYSIHDLTRVHSDEKSGLPRFNMPFEFGMAFLLTESPEYSHDWLGLLPGAHTLDLPPGAHAFGEFISDLAGYDLPSHDETPDTIIPPVLAWLSTRQGCPPVPRAVTSLALCELMDEFLRLLDREETRWKDQLPWSQIVKVAQDMIASKPWRTDA